MSVVTAKVVGLQTHANGEQYVSFRIVEGSFLSGPWKDLYELTLLPPRQSTTQEDTPQ